VSRTFRSIPVGLLYMAAAAFCLSIMSLMVKWVGQRLPMFEIVAGRSFLMLLLAYLHLQWIGRDPWGNDRPRLLLRGVLGFCALSCFYYGITHLPLADATMLQYLNPIFTAIIAAIFLGESIRPIEIGGMVASLVGVALIQQPPFLFGGEARLEPFPVVVALGGALFSASAYVTIRSLRETEHPIVIIFFFSLVAAPASLPLAWPSALMPQGIEWLLLLGIGAVTYVAQICLTRGLQLEKAGRAAAVTYLQIVFAFGWDMLVFDQFPTPLSLAGGVLIVGSALTITWMRARRGGEEVEETDVSE
jgi:drug/metabolite transporter (DMT)-like permease